MCVGERVARNAGVADETRDLLYCCGGFARIDQTLRLVEDVAVGHGVLEPRSARGGSGVLCDLLAQAHRTVLCAERIALLLETRDFLLFMREGRDVHRVCVHGTGETDAVLPCLAVDDLGNGFLPENLQNAARNNAYLVLGEGEVFRLGITLDVDARLLGRRAQRLLACGIAGVFGRVDVTDDTGTLGGDGLRRGRCGAAAKGCQRQAKQKEQSLAHDLLPLRLLH